MSVHVFYGLQTKQSGYVHYQKKIRRWNNASLHFCNTFFWLSWVILGSDQCTSRSSPTYLFFLTNLGDLPATNVLSWLLPQLFCYWSIFIQVFLCPWNSAWPFQVVCLSGLALVPTSYSASKFLLPSMLESYFRKHAETCFDPEFWHSIIPDSSCSDGSKPGLTISHCPWSGRYVTQPWQHMVVLS